MLYKEKYHGEIWLPDKENERCFCVLFYKDRQVFLETNLTKPEQEYVNRHPKIMGLFTGIGHVTFIDCELRNISEGAINSYIYQSKYTFAHPTEFFSPELTTKSFSISYNGLLDWRRWGPSSVPKEQIIKYGREESHMCEIAQKQLTIELKFYSRLNFGKNKTIAQNYCKIRLHYDIAVPIGRAIGDYETFQKLIQFLTGNAPSFDSFSYLGPISNEWGTVTFEKNSFKEMNSFSVMTKFTDISKYLPNLIQLLFTDKKLLFCVDRLLDNHSDGRLSHSKRFTNSIAAFEAFTKLYTARKNTKLYGFLEEQRDLITKIMSVEESMFKDFAIKIVRSRAHHVHANIDDHHTTNIFTDFELLYISFALDVIIAIRLLEQADIPTNIIDKIINQAQMTYSGLQELNLELRQDSIRSWRSN